MMHKKLVLTNALQWRFLSISRIAEIWREINIQFLGH